MARAAIVVLVAQAVAMLLYFAVTRSSRPLSLVLARLPVILQFAPVSVEPAFAVR